MPPCKPTFRAKPAGGLRVCTSLERIVAFLQERTENDQAVVATVTTLMNQGRLRRPPTDGGVCRDRAA